MVRVIRCFTLIGFALPSQSAFAFVATHNHFVLDRGGKVFNRSAPVIKLLLKCDGSRSPFSAGSAQ